jgi:hypothetical protein
MERTIGIDLAVEPRKTAAVEILWTAERAEDFLTPPSRGPGPRWTHRPGLHHRSLNG